MRCDCRHLGAYFDDKLSSLGIQPRVGSGYSPVCEVTAAILHGVGSPDSGTFHSRLLSRCAALLNPSGRDGAVFTEGRARAHISCPWSVESRSEWQLHLSCYETSNRQQSASPIALSAGNAIYPREKDRGLPPRVHVLKGGLQVLHRTFRSPSPGSPSGKVARSS